MANVTSGNDNLPIWQLALTTTLPAFSLSALAVYLVHDRSQNNLDCATANTLCPPLWQTTDVIIVILVASFIAGCATAIVRYVTSPSSNPVLEAYEASVKDPYDSGVAWSPIYMPRHRRARAGLTGLLYAWRRAPLWKAMGSAFVWTVGIAWPFLLFVDLTARPDPYTRALECSRTRESPCDFEKASWVGENLLVVLLLLGLGSALLMAIWHRPLPPGITESRREKKPRP